MDHQEEVCSHGVCVDETGQVLQVCAAPLGARPSLCCCAPLVIGVDLFEGNWRLWNWSAIERKDLERSLSLDPTCQRAFVRAEPSSDRFWLIEELPTGVCVTHRNASTLEQVAPEEHLPGTRLGFELEEHPLNGYQIAGLVPYHDSLLLLANATSNDELVLYQVQ